MMKKVNLSQLLSRSPRHGGRRASTNGEVLEVFMGRASSSPAPPPPRPEKIAKKKSKTGILQTLKKKISGKLDACQGSNCSSPKKSKSFEGLSNSFGDSFSQSVSEESSTDGLSATATATAGQPHKTKHNKRAIRPIHTPITRQNSSSMVLADTEGGLSVRSPPTKPTESGGASEDQQQTPITPVSLYGKPPNHISETAEVLATPLPDAAECANMGVTTTAPRVLVDGLAGGDGHTGHMGVIKPVPRVLVDGVGGGDGHTGHMGVTKGVAGGGAAPQSVITETSSPVSYEELWGPQDTNMDPSKRSLAEELFRLAKFGWYWGPITRAEAEEKLLDQPDGAFLVRDSSDDKYLLSLSFRSYNKTLHTRIEHSNGWFSFYPHPEHEGHTSLVGLIDHCMSHSEAGVFCYSRARVPGSPSFPVRLTKPVSRFTQVRSLQYLCRFVIRQYTRVDHIQSLPLPPRIKGYLEEGHY